MMAAAPTPISVNQRPSKQSPSDLFEAVAQPSLLKAAVQPPGEIHLSVALQEYGDIMGEHRGKI